MTTLTNKSLQRTAFDVPRFPTLNVRFHLQWTAAPGRQYAFAVDQWMTATAA